MRKWCLISTQCLTILAAVISYSEIHTRTIEKDNIEFCRGWIYTDIFYMTRSNWLLWHASINITYLYIPDTHIKFQHQLSVVNSLLYDQSMWISLYIITVNSINSLCWTRKWYKYTFYTVRYKNINLFINRDQC